MPQAELKFSNDITIDVAHIFKSIDSEISNFDPSAGACKCRAYPATEFLHTHVLLNIRLLRKPHRDEAFMNTLLNKLKSILESAVPNGCSYAVDLSFFSGYYLTEQKH